MSSSFEKSLIYFLEKKRIPLDSVIPGYGYASELKDYVTGLRMPSRERLLDIINWLALGGRESERLINAYEFSIMSNMSGKSQIQHSRTETSEKFEGQLENVQKALDSVTKRLDTVSSQSSNTHDLKQELQNLKTEILETVKPQISQLEQTGKELSATVMWPSKRDMQIQLVNINSLDRLEEYRSNQGTWSAFAGLFLGAILGVLINWATGAAMTDAAWVLVIAFFVVSIVFGYFYHIDNMRVQRVKNQMLDRDNPIVADEQMGRQNLIQTTIAGIQLTISRKVTNMDE